MTHDLLIQIFRIIKTDSYQLCDKYLFNKEDHCKRTHAIKLKFVLILSKPNHVLEEYNVILLMVKES